MASSPSSGEESTLVPGFGYKVLPKDCTEGIVASPRSGVQRFRVQQSRELQRYQELIN